MIDFVNVTKKYSRTTAINRMTLTISENGIYCLLGKNGAGKTTFMKLLAGYIGATEGEIAVNGQSVTPSHMPKSVNFIESNSEQFNMRVSDLIESAAALQEDFDKDFAWEMIERFDLKPGKKYKQLSFGMKTMLSTILTLANNSKIILLDEPTLGFDAIMRDQFNTLLLESYQAQPRIIIVSTHMIDEIAKITEQLIIINNGEILLKTGIEDIDEHAYTLTGPEKVISPLIKELNCIGKTSVGSMMAAHIYGDRIAPPSGVSLDRLTLQDFFIQIVGGNDHE